MEQVEELAGVGGILRRAVAYSDKVFDLRNQWGRVRDSRPRPQIPPPVFPATLFLMFLCRLRSFNELEQYRDRGSWRRWLGHGAPSVDEIAYVSERAGRQWSSSIQTHHWTRVTTLSQGEAPTSSLVRFGHARWRIENQGFNELGTFWHCDHSLHRRFHQVGFRSR